MGTGGAAGTTTGASFSGGSGSGLVVDVVVADATSLTKITVTSGGSGYKTGDVLTFATVGDGSTAGDYATFQYTLTDGDFERKDLPEPIFKQNGMMYDITFESGCRTHADCRNNGIDENASDGPDPTPLIEGNDMGAVCHPGGACICSSDSFFGDGCTTDGRASHAAPKKYVSGNINNLECDKSGLTPSIPLRITGTVSRANPRKIVLSGTAQHDSEILLSNVEETTEGSAALNTLGTFDSYALSQANQVKGFDVVIKGNGLSKTIASSASDSTYTTTTGFGSKHAAADLVKLTNLANGVKVGDRIRMEGQVRKVTYVSPVCNRGSASSGDTDLCDSLVSAHYIMVEEDFVEDEFSSYTNIFDANTAIERVESDSQQAANIGADLATCVVTDMRQLSTTTELCTGTDGPTCGKAVVDAGDMLDESNTADNSRITMHSGLGLRHAALMDSREVEIGDRIRLTKTAGATSTVEVWETRTADSVTYSVKKDKNTDPISQYTLFDGMVHHFTVTEAFTRPAATVADEKVEAPAAIYNYGSGTMEAKVCSGRGLCDESTGECTCFAGYTDVDCSVQNALAV